MRGFAFASHHYNFVLIPQGKDLVPKPSGQDETDRRVGNGTPSLRLCPHDATPLRDPALAAAPGLLADQPGLGVPEHPAPAPDIAAVTW